jgi:8-hydroxy-5-deazaflavin:NADPH oxidoreductase
MLLWHKPINADRSEIAMNIGMIGAGNLGTGLTKHLVPNGHAVMLSFSKDMERLKSSADSLGARTGTPAQAVDFADLVVLATPWAATAEALQQIGKVSKSKILWDCTNALKPDMSGLLLGTTTSGGEEVAKLAPWAKVVKAIPPFAEVLHSQSMLIDGTRAAVFICGDDAEARGVVARLVEDIGGAPVDAGPLSLARYTEPACMLLVQLAYMQGLGARIGLTLAHESPKSASEARAS